MGDKRVREGDKRVREGDKRVRSGRQECEERVRETRG